MKGRIFKNLEFSTYEGWDWETSRHNSPDEILQHGYGGVFHLDGAELVADAHDKPIRWRAEDPADALAFTMACMEVLSQRKKPESEESPLTGQAA